MIILINSRAQWPTQASAAQADDHIVALISQISNLLAEILMRQIRYRINSLAIGLYTHTDFAFGYFVKFSIVDEVPHLFLSLE